VCAFFKWRFYRPVKSSATIVLLALGAAPLAAQTAAPAPAQPADPVLRMGQVDVTAKQETLMNTIDRKVYNLGGDVQAVTGSAADVLRNIPSVEVDMDGNISLRGDTSVQILIDGRSSALMGTAGRADVLTQMPADSIERIEVITSPSAKYKPDGTGGIINIVLKKKRALGYSGSARATGGNRRRYGASAGGNYNPGPYNLSGNYSVRQDDRPRSTADQRHYVDPATNLPASTQSRTSEESRPFFQIGQIGLEFGAGPMDRLREVVDFSYRTFDRHVVEHDTLTDNLGITTTDYLRLRYDPENEGNFQSKSTYEHAFGGYDRKLIAEVRLEHHAETERNHYTNLYTTPVGPPAHEYIRVAANEPGAEATVEYTDSSSKASRLEFGVDGSQDKSTQDHLDLVQDPVTGVWVENPVVTNSFFMDQSVAAIYGTYSRVMGHFGAMVGARVEAADLRTNQITAGIVSDQRYERLYPSLHLSYDVSDAQQVQLSYSHRVRRPEGDDLNPYPRYQDPYNLSAGNPYLRPEEVHSLEAGYQYKDNATTYLATLYYRYSYNSFTQVSRYVSSTTLLTTEANLGSSQSGGLEVAATLSPTDKLTLNASGNLFRSQIDASNLGYDTRQSTFAWAGKLSAEYAFSKASLVQFNANYTAKRLTPQGYREPAFVANIGFKHELRSRKLTLVATVSDLFNSLKDETKLDTPVLHDDFTRRRSSRIIYLGIIYSFGAQKGKSKDDALQFDNQM
jgi:outer membrane receptor protein involved in Fe transport